VWCWSLQLELRNFFLRTVFVWILLV